MALEKEKLQHPYMPKIALSPPKTCKDCGDFGIFSGHECSTCKKDWAYHANQTKEKVEKIKAVGVSQKDVDAFVKTLLDLNQSIDKIATKTAPPKKIEKPTPKKEKEPIKVVNLKSTGTANHHDAWLFYKPEATLFYIPKAHHYDLFMRLMETGRQDICDKAMNTKKDIDEIRFGDVKHAIPRTVKENEIKKEPLRSILIGEFNKARGN